MSGDILQTPDAPKPQGALDNYFKITARGSTVRQEILAGLTTFLAMVYSVIVVPGMLGKAGFPPAAVFVATCLVAGFGSLLMGLWANLPMAIGCAISPDWVRYEKDKGWQLKAEKTLISSYDAIRVYMWVGMMPDSDPQKARMLNRFKPMATFTEKNGYPPEKVDVATGKAQGKGPVGFSAAMLPFLQNRDAQAVQRQRVADNFPGSDAYYNYVLTLFGQGWDQHRFRFSTKGELLPDWGQECANSH